VHPNWIEMPYFDGFFETSFTSQDKKFWSQHYMQDRFTSKWYNKNLKYGLDLVGMQRITQETGLHWTFAEDCTSLFGNGHTNHFAVNILEGAISGKKGCGKTSTTIIQASRQKHSSWQLYSDGKDGLQQTQMESCKPIKRLKDKNNNQKLRSKSWTWISCSESAVFFLLEDVQYSNKLQSG
jgi:hypothetical protein